MNIKVTQEDIDQGVRRDNWMCPIALALFRETHWRWNVNGDVANIIGLGAHGDEVMLPARARAFVYQFDTETTVRPFAFFFPCDAEIKKAEKWLRLQKESKAVDNSE